MDEQFLDELGKDIDKIDPEEEARKQAELNSYAEQYVTDAMDDPRRQMYLMNRVTGRLLHSDGAVHRALESHGKEAIGTISWNKAMDLWRKEQAEKKAAWLKVQARKRAKQARKRNR